MSSRRQQRVAELIHQEISNLLEFNTHDPRIGLVTVTEVEVTPDLKNATIYVTFMADDKAEVMAGLESAVPFFRRELGRNVKLRHTPALRFKLDSSLDYGQKIETLLSGIDIPPEPDPDDTQQLDDVTGPGYDS